MESSFVLTVGKDEYRMALPAAQTVEAEKRLGGSLLSVSEHVDQTAVVATALWAGLQKYNHGMSPNKVMDLIDRMQEEGCSFNGVEFQDFSAEVCAKLFSMLLVISGFFTQETAQQIRTEIA
ncbi:MAG: hypothetical protein RRZ24_11150 [Clostridia bacterium]